MSEELGLMAAASIHHQYLDGGAQMDCSQETAAKVDAAVQKLLNNAYAKAKQVLTENRALLDQIAEYLLSKETITGEEMMSFIHPPKAEEPAEEPAENPTEE
jgi:cell division protease FtsH